MPQTSYAADMWTTLQEWWSLPDWIAGGILLVGLLGGIRRGLSGELSRLLALVLSFSGAWHFHRLAVPLLQSRLDWGEDALRLTSFVSIFLLLPVFRFFFELFNRTVIKPKRLVFDLKLSL